MSSMHTHSLHGIRVADALGTSTVGSLSGTLVVESGDASRRALQLQGHIASFQASISAIERCRYPVIVATHGVTYGLSVDIIAACDIRYAASNTSFAIKVGTRDSSLLLSFVLTGSSMHPDVSSLAPCRKSTSV